MSICSIIACLNVAGHAPGCRCAYEAAVEEIEAGGRAEDISEKTLTAVLRYNLIKESCERWIDDFDKFEAFIVATGKKPRRGAGKGSEEKRLADFGKGVIRQVNVNGGAGKYEMACGKPRRDAWDALVAKYPEAFPVRDEVWIDDFDKYEAVIVATGKRPSNPTMWNGKNYLGFALMRARNVLKKQEIGG